MSGGWSRDAIYAAGRIGPALQALPVRSSPHCHSEPRVNPQYNSLQMADNLSDSHYHALQTSLNRRFSHDWQSQVSYTYSKSIDNGSGTYGLDGGGIASQPTQCTRGSRAFQLQPHHTISVSAASIRSLSRSKVSRADGQRLAAHRGIYLSFRRPGQSDFRHQPRVYRHRPKRGPSGCGRRMRSVRRIPALARAVVQPGLLHSAAARHLRQRGPRHHHRTEPVEPGQLAHQGLEGNQDLGTVRGAVPRGGFQHPEPSVVPESASCTIFAAARSIPARAKSRRPTARRGRSSWP